MDDDRDALNNRSRAISISGDVHEYKVRVRTDNNEQADEIVVPSLSMAMDSFKLQPWFPLLPIVIGSVAQILGAYQIPMAISATTPPEEIFSHIIQKNTRTESCRRELLR